MHIRANPLFYMELGRLYLEMAVADTKFGEGEKRDEFKNLGVL